MRQPDESFVQSYVKGVWDTSVSFDVRSLAWVYQTLMYPLGWGQTERENSAENHRVGPGLRAGGPCPREA
jgi:hypothetical protein